MGRRDDALREALGARDRIVAEMQTFPDELRFTADLSGACKRLAAMKLAAGALAWPALLRKCYRLDPGFAT